MRNVFTKEVLAILKKILILIVSIITFKTNIVIIIRLVKEAEFIYEKQKQNTTLSNIKL